MSLQIVPLVFTVASLSPCFPGIIASPSPLTKDGIKSPMGINHVGHFLFTMRLLPALKEASPSRVVNVSSYAHMETPKGGIDFDNLLSAEPTNIGLDYGESKLANILFTRGFDKRFGDQGIYANALHPGGVRTDIFEGAKKGILRLFGPILDLVVWSVGLTPMEGALTQLYVATSPDIVEQKMRGRYFIPFGKDFTDQISGDAKDDQLVEKLWTWTEDIVKEKLAR